MCVLDGTWLRKWLQRKWLPRGATETMRYHPYGPQYNAEGETRILWGRRYRFPRNTSRRDVRIETANTNVSLMHCAVWIRNRRQASRRVASPRRDEAPAQKFPRIQDVRARTRARVCVYVLSSQYRDLSRICVHIARRARSAFSRSNSVALFVSEICAWIIISVLRCSHGISKETSKADKKKLYIYIYIYVYFFRSSLWNRARKI